MILSNNNWWTSLSFAHQFIIKNISVLERLQRLYVVKQSNDCFTMQWITLSDSMEWRQQNLKKTLRKTESNIGAWLRRHGVNYSFSCIYTCIVRDFNPFETPSNYPIYLSSLYVIFFIEYATFQHKTYDNNPFLWRY